jgi:hypothetical protein
MGNCDISNGRNLADCLNNRAGIKTVFFFKHSLVNVTKDAAGLITGFGSGVLYRFEQDGNNGLLFQEVQRGDDSQFVLINIDMSLYYDAPEFMSVINHLKSGLWAVFVLDYDDKIRMAGEWSPMQETQAAGQSGTGPSDLLYTNLTFVGQSGDFIPYLEDFTEYPFDNFPVAIIPPYVETPKEILINANDYLNIDNLGNRLSYG